MEELITKNKETNKIKAYIMLIITAFGWALSTIIIKIYVEAIPPFHLLTSRFVIATLFIFLTNPRKIKSISKKDIKVGSLTGVFLFAAYACGITALKYTTASKSGFLVALSVLFVPIVETIIRKKLPSKWIVISVLISLVGLRLISGINGTGFNIGDLIAIGCAASYTVYILLIDRLGNNIDDFILTITQLTAVSIVGFICAVIFEGINIECIKSGLIPILVMAILGTALSTLLQIKAQKIASPESVGIILLGEPLFTLIMAYFILNETIIFVGMVGAVLLLFSLVMAIVKKL